MNDTYQQPGQWHDVILTPTPRASSEPLAHIMSFTLKSLQPSSVYETILQAKNRYGWNEVNKLMWQNNNMCRECTCMMGLCGALQLWLLRNVHNATAQFVYA